MWSHLDEGSRIHKLQRQRADQGLVGTVGEGRIGVTTKMWGSLQGDGCTMLGLYGKPEQVTVGVSQ